MVEPTLGNTIGATFLGIIGSAILFGASSSQVFTYYTHYKNDWKLQKFFVGWLMLISLIHVIFAAHCVYFYLIKNYGDAVALQKILWSFKAQAVLDVITVTTVQGLYAWRVRTLGKQHFSRIWPWIVIGTALGIGWAFEFMLAVNICQSHTWDKVEKFRWVLFGSFSTATIIDIVISSALCYYLKSRSSRSIFTETNNKVVGIMQYALAFGFFTSAFSFAALITLAAMPNTLVFVGMDFLLPRMYMFSYMTLLNARRVNAEKDASSFNMTGGLNQFRSSAWADQKPTVTMEAGMISSRDAISLGNSRYFPGGKTSQPEPNIGVTIQRTENRHYDTQV